jgi:exoribonuclease-2
LVIKLSGVPQLPRGAHVKLELIAWDELDLTIEARLLHVEQEIEAIDDEADEMADPADVADAVEAVETVVETAIESAPDVSSEVKSA